MIPDFVKTLLANPLVQARVKNGLGVASIAVGTWTLSHMVDWFGAHASFVSHADALAIAGTIATCAAGLVLTVGSAVYSTIVDPNNVNAKIITAAATGNAACANDAPTVAAVKDAVKTDAATPGSTAALDDLVAKLGSGKV